jgi:hypothetical protein
MIAKSVDVERIRSATALLGEIRQLLGTFEPEMQKASVPKKSSAAKVFSEPQANEEELPVNLL